MVESKWFYWWRIIWENDFGGIWTHDLDIKSVLLCQLSYEVFYLMLDMKYKTFQDFFAEMNCRVQMIV